MHARIISLSGNKNKLTMTNFMQITLIMTCCILKESLSLELTKIVIPAFKLHSEPALLECHYQLNASKNNKRDYSGYRSIHANVNDNNGLDDLYGNGRRGNSDSSSSHSDGSDEEETLYSVKWYKDNEEFYRYVPRANPPQRIYNNVEGVRVDLQASNDVKVLLKKLNLKSGGLYRCEISAEAPNFSSVEGEGRMEIVYLPKEGPVITGEQTEYQIGDTLNINCTSGRSHPYSTIQWFINDEPVYQSHLIHYPNITHPHGLVTTILGLQVVLDGSHFKNGSMRVKCLTSVSPVLSMTSSSSSSSSGSGGTDGVNGGINNGRISYVQRRPLLDNREAMLLVRSASATAFATFEQWKILAISTLATTIISLQIFT